MATNIEIVQDAYGRFGSGDIPGLIGLCTEDVVWQTPEVENASFGGKRHGHAGVGEFFTALVAHEEMTLFEPTEFIDGGEKVVVLGRSASTAHSTGRSYETDWVQIFTITDGKISGFLEFFDNAAASRAFATAA